MTHRTASLLSSLAVAVLALTVSASLWCSPAPRSHLAAECIA